jgi:hypothetical protein
MAKHHTRAKSAKGKGKPGLFGLGGGGGGRGKDFFGLKQQIVKGLDNNTIYMGAGGIVLVGGVVMMGAMGIIPIPGFGNASTATVNVYPANVKTGDLVTFEGDFRGVSGGMVTLYTAYIAVFEDTGNKVYDSTLGMFVSHYKVQVPTANYRDGSYTVVVSDKPISGPAGVTPNPVTGVAALNTTTPPQTVAAPSVGGAPVTLT